MFAHLSKPSLMALLLVEKEEREKVSLSLEENFLAHYEKAQEKEFNSWRTQRLQISLLFFGAALSFVVAAIFTKQDLLSFGIVGTGMPALWYLSQFQSTPKILLSESQRINFVQNFFKLMHKELETISDTELFDALAKKVFCCIYEEGRSFKEKEFTLASLLSFADEDDRLRDFYSLLLKNSFFVEMVTEFVRTSNTTNQNIIVFLDRVSYSSTVRHLAKEAATPLKETIFHLEEVLA
ncbi:MAG: hypothetical protein ACKVTZ_07785 [Bacteroidia bacterium]